MRAFHYHGGSVVRYCLLPLLVTFTNPSMAVMVLGGTDPAANKAAPTGQYADSGWQFQGEFGSYLGTMISPTQFITAKHIGTSPSTFVHHSTFSGGTTVTYSVDNVNYHDIPGSDLRVYNIIGDVFPTYAEIYAKPVTLGLDFVTFGRGNQRGAEVYGEARNQFGNVIGTELKGWQMGTSNAAARWGTNEISGGLIHSTLGELFFASFDNNGDPNEAYLSVGDSGGGVFVFDTDDNTWKLAGINYGDGGFFNTAPTGTGAFRGAIFDRGGLYVPNSWVQLTDQAGDLPASITISDVSARYDYLMQNVIVTPEPGSACLLILSGIWLLGKRLKH